MTELLAEIVVMEGGLHMKMGLRSSSNYSICIRGYSSSHLIIAISMSQRMYLRPISTTLIGTHPKQH